jgi:hypothetical protein
MAYSINENTGNLFKIGKDIYLEDGKNYSVEVRMVDESLKGTFCETKEDGFHIVSQFSVTGCSTVEDCLESIECMLQADIEEGEISQDVYWRRPDLGVDS